MSHQIFFALSTQPVLTRQFQIVLVFGKAFERVRDSCARKTFENFGGSLSSPCFWPTQKGELTESA